MFWTRYSRDRQRITRELTRTNTSPQIACFTNISLVRFISQQLSGLIYFVWYFRIFSSGIGLNHKSRVLLLFFNESNSAIMYWGGFSSELRLDSLRLGQRNEHLIPDSAWTHVAKCLQNVRILSSLIVTPGVFLLSMKQRLFLRANHLCRSPVVLLGNCLFTALSHFVP